MSKSVERKKSTLTIELERETLAELKAATIIFGAKSYSSLVHQQIVLKIREAKNMVSPEEFENLRDQQLEEINTRSQQKSLERKKSLSAGKKSDPATAKLTGKNLDKPKGKTFSTRSKTVTLVEESPYVDADEE